MGFMDYLPQAEEGELKMKQSKNEVGTSEKKEISDWLANKKRITTAILKMFDLPEEYRQSVGTNPAGADKHKYLVFIYDPDTEIECSRVFVNEKTHSIDVSFNREIDPVISANIAVNMMDFYGVEIYESYKLNDKGEATWWNEKLEIWK